MNLAQGEAPPVRPAPRARAAQPAVQPAAQLPAQPPTQPPAQATVPSRAERRRHARTRTYMVATVNYGRLLLPCFVLDLSAAGAKVRMFDQEPLPAGPCELECGRFGKATAEIVWYRAGFAGLKFAAPIALDPARIATP